MQMQIIDLIKEANVHELQHLPEGVPAASEIRHQGAIRLVGAILDAHVRQRDALSLHLKQLQKRGKGIAEPLGGRGTDASPLDHVSIGGEVSIKAQHDAPLGIEGKGPIKGAGKKIAEGRLIGYKFL